MLMLICHHKFNLKVKQNTETFLISSCEEVSFTSVGFLYEAKQWEFSSIQYFIIQEKKKTAVTILSRTKLPVTCFPAGIKQFHIIFFLLFLKGVYQKFLHMAFSY